MPPEPTTVPTEITAERAGFTPLTLRELYALPDEPAAGPADEGAPDFGWIVARCMADITPTTRAPYPAEGIAAGITWDDLVAIEPRLLELLAEAEASAARGAPCANAVWYGYRGSGLKGRMSRLVGHLAPDDVDPRLRTATAYDVAYDHIYAALPDCTHEGIC